MEIIETSSGKKNRVEISPVAPDDYKLLQPSRYFFKWEKEQKEEVYKLTIEGSMDILGLISLERIPNEWRIHIRLLMVSKENKGTSKKYDGVASNLITYATKLALTEYGEVACVSLKPKSNIAHHYIDKYQMQNTGSLLYIELTEILDLINIYDHGK